jgi:hypothetical protein
VKITFEVEFEDGRKIEAAAKPKDIIAFERQYDRSFTGVVDDLRFEHLCYLAWSPLHRQKRDPRAFDEFMDDVEDIGVKDDDPEPVPFGKAPAAETSPASQ